MRLKVPGAGLKVGDVIYRCEHSAADGGAGSNWGGSQGVCVVPGDSRIDHDHYGLGYVQSGWGHLWFVIERQDAVGLPTGPVAALTRVIPDWPHDCPRCKGKQCAINLAVAWDCRNGCFKRGASW